MKELQIVNPLFSLSSGFSSEASQATMHGPHSHAEAGDADAAAGSAVPPPSSSSPSSSPLPSSASAFCPINPSRHIVERQSRMLNFMVEYRQRTVELVLEESRTISEHHPLRNKYMHYGFTLRENTTQKHYLP